MQLEAQKKTSGLKIVAVLALAQAVAGVLRALQWFDIGSDLKGDGLLLKAIRRRERWCGPSYRW